MSNLLRAFVEQVAAQPDRDALVVQCNGEIKTLSWADLAGAVVDHADFLETCFRSDPVLPRCVGYSSRNSLGDVITALACPLVGAIEAPFDQHIDGAREVFDQELGGYWIDDFAGGVGNRDRDQVISRITQASTFDVDAPALILWTSGTTAKPKGVTLTHRNLYGNAQAKLTAVPQNDEDVRLTALPLCHGYARTSDFGTWLLSGCTLAIGLGFAAWHALGTAVQPTLANTAPSLAARLLAADPESIGISRLRLLGCGGAAMSVNDFDAWARRGVTVIQGYGLTEASPVICSATPDNATAGLVGDFVDGWEHEIRDGRLFVRGPHVMQSYWDDPIETAARIDADGWLDTCDIVQRDEVTDQIRILGRADDVIVLDSGRKVHPQAIEKKIEQIAGVRHAMLVAAGRDLAVWLDAESINEIESLIAEQLSQRPSWERPRTVHYFSQPLTQQAGELTSKGTIRREVLLGRIC